MYSLFTILLIITPTPRLVMTHINTIITDTPDPLQFTYRPNRSTIALHTALSHLDKRGNKYVRMLLRDYSSAFNTIVPSELHPKLQIPYSRYV
jgi:hypothetical protein